jgi:8-oxo-dGTP pyrophosphatase MutT (NUDIX family)
METEMKKKTDDETEEDKQIPLIEKGTNNGVWTPTFIREHTIVSASPQTQRCFIPLNSRISSTEDDGLFRYNHWKQKIDTSPVLWRNYNNNNNNNQSHTYFTQHANGGTHFQKKTQFPKKIPQYRSTISECSSTTTTSQRSSLYCNNCGKNGHSLYHCTSPITSYGVIPVRHVTNSFTGKTERQYLMIRRRDTLTYFDFLRGKYSLFNRKYIKDMVKMMTETEKIKILTQPFDVLWENLWKDNVVIEPADDVGGRRRTDTPHKQTKNGEKHTPRDKFNVLQTGYLNEKRHFTISEIVNELELEMLLDKNIEVWKEPEWGFCKGRRNYKESDYDCALREMEEETGYSGKNMVSIQNINTFEETFMGSNFKCYKHKYYLMCMSYEDSLNIGNFEKTEVSCIKWVSIHECLSLIRSYNVEKKKMIANIDNVMNKYFVFV